MKKCFGISFTVKIRTINLKNVDGMLDVINIGFPLPFELPVNYVNKPLGVFGASRGHVFVIVKEKIIGFRFHFKMSN